MNRLAVCAGALLILFIEHFSNISGSTIKLFILLFMMSRVLRSREQLVLFGLFFMINPNLDLSSGLLFEFIQIIYFPVAYYFFRDYYKFQMPILELSYLLSCVVLLSSLLFHLSFLEQNKLMESELNGIAQLYNVASNKYFHFGFFDHPQTASKIYSVATIVLLFRKRKNLFDYSLVLLGLYTLYVTYVRLGWLVVIVASILYIRSFNKRYYRYILYALISIVFIYFLPLISNRLLNDSFEFSLSRVSSGRDLLLIASLDYFWDGTPLVMLMGSGYTAVMGTIGYAHNRVVEILLFAGFLGLFWWSIVYRKIYSDIFWTGHMKYEKKSILFLIVLSLVFSHGFSPFLSLLVAMRLSWKDTLDEL